MAYFGVNSGFYNEVTSYPGTLFNINTIFLRYGDSIDEDKTVVRPSNPYHMVPYTCKTASLYWNGSLLTFGMVVNNFPSDIKNNGLFQYPVRYHK